MGIKKGLDLQPLKGAVHCKGVRKEGDKEAKEELSCLTSGGDSFFLDAGFKKIKKTLKIFWQNKKDDYFCSRF